MRMKQNTFTSLFVLATLVWAGVLYGQNNIDMDNPDKEESRLYYHAGRTRGIKRPDGSFIKELSDGVEAWHHDAVLKAEEGIYDSYKGEICFYGNAAFKDSVRHLNADTLIYYENNHEAFAIGNVRVTERGRSLWAERVRYLKDLSVIEAFGNVAVKDDSIRSSIYGMEAVFNDSTGHGFVIGEPVLIREDKRGSIITITCSDTLEILEEEKIVRLWNDVVATKDSLKAVSKLALYDDSNETLTLTGDPEITYMITENREDVPSALSTVSVVTGDTIKVYIKERQVTGAKVIGSTVSTTTSTDTTGTLYERSLIESAVMRLEMDDDFISLITAEGTARSFYHRKQTEDNEMFVNVASGDTLTFFFDRGKITEMKIYGFGGGLGKGMYYEYLQEETSAVTDSTGTVRDITGSR